ARLAAVLPLRRAYRRTARSGARHATRGRSSRLADGRGVIEEEVGASVAALTPPVIPEAAAQTTWDPAADAGACRQVPALRAMTGGTAVVPAPAPYYVRTRMGRGRRGSSWHALVMGRVYGRGFRRPGGAQCHA